MLYFKSQNFVSFKKGFFAKADKALTFTNSKVFDSKGMAEKMGRDSENRHLRMYARLAGMLYDINFPNSNNQVHLSDLRARLQAVGLLRRLQAAGSCPKNVFNFDSLLNSLQNLDEMVHANLGFQQLLWPGIKNLQQTVYFSVFGFV